MKPIDWARWALVVVLAWAISLGLTATALGATLAIAPEVVPDLTLTLPVVGEVGFLDLLWWLRR